MIARWMTRSKAGQPAGVFEDIHTTPRKRLFYLLDIPVDFTPLAWLNLLSMLPAALALTFIFYPSASTLERLGWTALWVFVMQLTQWIHSIGHIISGKIAGSPMDSLLITATRQVNLYEGDQSRFPPRVHILRAVGGGLANISVSLIGLIIMANAGVSPTLLLLTAFNLVGIAAYLPFESVDGSVIIRYLPEYLREVRSRNSH